MNKGKLYLIPSPLGENDPAEVIPGPVLKSLEGFRTFVVEEVRTVRRYLSRAGLKGKSENLNFTNSTSIRMLQLSRVTSGSLITETMSP